MGAHPASSPPAAAPIPSRKKEDHGEPLEKVPRCNGIQVLCLGWRIRFDWELFPFIGKGNFMSLFPSF